MSDTYLQCPKCNYKPLEPLPISEPCPACGIYVFKWGRTPRRVALNTYEDTSSIQRDGFLVSLFRPLDKMDPSVFYGRCFALLLLGWWSWYLIAYDYRYGEIFGSFIHNILLPIHEAGHVLSIPFGEFITILGGSLFQLALPLGISIAFILINRDNFGATTGLWLTSASLLDLSPYIYDALQPQLILLGGHTGEDGPHDWIFLLTSFGHLHHAQRLGTFVHGFGSILMTFSLVWGAYMLSRQRSQLILTEE